MNKTILITGVSKGLGKALTEKFISLGHTIIGCARSYNAIKELQNKYPDNYFSVLNVANYQEVKKWLKSLPQIPDLVINNAAIINQPAPLWEIPTSDFDQLIDVNIKGTANIIREIVPMMMNKKEGIIVNFSSGWGRSTSPEVAPYCASKWAIEGLTKALAQELPNNLATVALNPGVINTEMLNTCFGEQAKLYDSIEDWVKRAVPFLLQLSLSNNGDSLTVN